MQINFAHLRQPSTHGGWVNFAVFDAHATFNSDAANAQALAQLTTKVRMAGYSVDQSTLAFNENGKLKFFGSKNLVDFLAHS